VLAGGTVGHRVASIRDRQPILMLEDERSPAMARVDELVDGIYRISTTVQLPGTDFQFNQFLIDDERPAFIHTGMYGLYQGSVTPSRKCSIRASSST
jgi:hypothetical protein